jgi:hypothetical protein
MEAQAKKNSTTDNAFKAVDKQELFQKRKEMMRARTTDKLDKLDVSGNQGHQKTDSINNIPENLRNRMNTLSPISRRPDSNNASMINLSKPATPNMSLLGGKDDKKSKEPPQELLERLAMGQKSKVRFCGKN